MLVTSLSWQQTKAFLLAAPKLLATLPSCSNSRPPSKGSTRWQLDAPSPKSCPKLKYSSKKEPTSSHQSLISCLQEAIHWAAQQAAVHWIAPLPRTVSSNYLATGIVQSALAGALNPANSYGINSSSTHWLWNAGLQVSACSTYQSFQSIYKFTASHEL